MPDLSERLESALAERYAIERELGEGGMAVVYLAHDLRHDRQVALKVLRPDLSATLGPERFLREVRIAAQLQHPNILPVYDSGEAAGLLFYVMPYVEGPSLRARLSAHGELPVADAARILRDVADALAHAHAHGVVHRDIKPENVMLAGRHALVADFGVAKAVSDATGPRTLTMAGVAVGTPAYMAPEQAVADPHTDHRADLYALGVMAYEMLAGQPPFDAPTAQALLAAHVTEAPVEVTRRRAAVPPPLAELVMRCLAKNPADRPQAADELLPVLEALATTSGGTTPAHVPAARAAGRPRLRGRALVAAGSLVVILGAVAAGRWLLSRGEGAGRDRAAIAVLPFQNLSAEGPYAYFAGGLHDELLTQLAKVSALSVRGRTSVMGYAGTAKGIRQIAEELSVGSLVEGSVQVDASRLRVNVQLIDAATDEHLWAERYDRTLDDAFAIQSDIARRIVAAVGATIVGPEQEAIADAPTANPEAYRLYLQGLEYYGRPGMLRRNWEIAQGFYQRALALDPTFALAHAALSEVHGVMSWFRYDPAPARLERQREEAEAALRLAPDLPQAHAAMGLLHYAGHQDWEAALREYRAAVERMPSSADLWAWVGYAHRRLAQWDEAMAALDRAATLDPRNGDVVFEGATTLRFLRRYREAADWYGRSAALSPDVPEGDVQRGWVWVLWQGRLDSLRAALDRYPPNTDLAGSSVTAERIIQLYWQRQGDSLLALLGRAGQPVFEAQDYYLPAALYTAWARQLCGDAAAARAAFAASLSLLDSVLAELPGDWRVHVARGLTLAGLGRRSEALKEAEWLERSPFYREDRFYQGPLAGEGRARILAQAGAAEPALQELERLLAGPAWISGHVLRLDPRWDPIRGDPRFAGLIGKYATAEPRP